MQQADTLIIGGGIIGLATAYRLQERRAGAQVVVLEKEAAVAQHQSGRNSGVLHSGIYYAPGSLKAATCRAGRRAMETFCRHEGIPMETCGKVIVAVDEADIPRLERIWERGQANGVPCRIISAAQLREMEPHAAGIRAIHVPSAGIVDFAQVCARLAARITERGGRIVTSARVTALRHDRTGMVADTTAGAFAGRTVVNCAGLHSDRVTRMSGETPPAKIVPFRGEFYALRARARHLCQTLIYPVPDPSFPFLGAHFTRTISGEVECGPNAVLAFAREGYGKADLHPRDLIESLTYSGFLRLAARHWRVGLAEMFRSFSTVAFARALQRLVPAVTPADLVPVRSGVRAQALRPDGTLVDDFLIVAGDRVVNVCNAPSPAATASLHIADTILDRLGELSQ